MTETPSIIHDRQEHVGRSGTGGGQASIQGPFSLRCESGIKALIRSGLETRKVGLHEFAERKAEAQGSIEKLVRAMINAQLTKDPALDILDEWTIFHVLHDEKLCPGLWPIC